MAQDFFNIEKGLGIESDSSSVLYLQGLGAPASDTDSQNAPVGSVWTNASNGDIYTKVSVGTTLANWEKLATEDFVTATTGASISWREPVEVHDSVSAAVPTGTAGNPITVDGVSITDGDRVLFSNVAGNNVYIYDQAAGTFSEDPNTESAGDTLYVVSGTDGGNRFTYNDAGNWVKTDLASLDELGYIRAFIGKNAPGSETPTYSSATTITQNEDLEHTIGELDAETDDLRDFIGKSASGSEVPNYSSATIVTQGGTLEQAIGELDANAAAGDTEDGYQNAFMGKSAGNDLPAYSSNNVVTDSDDLETAIGDLDAEIGPAVTDTDLITSTDSVNENIQSLADEMEISHKEVTISGVTTVQTIDSVVARFCEWDVLIDDGASKTFATKIMATHDGTSIDFNNAGRLKIGGNISGLSVDVTLSGGNTLNLTVVSTATVTVTSKRITAIV